MTTKKDYMQLHKRLSFFTIFMLVSYACHGDVLAEVEVGSSTAAQANNPLANMKAFNLHNYYIGELTGSGDNANQFWLRYAQPFHLGGDWLMRASLPINSFPTPPDGDRETGIGDLNVFAAYLFDTGNPAVSFGLGPQINAPTASSDSLGSDKWAGGIANVLFDARSKKFQYGYLLTWMASFAGDEDKPDTNIGAFQPFAIYQLGKGAYLRSTGIWVYDFETDNYSVPLSNLSGQSRTRGRAGQNGRFLLVLICSSLAIEHRFVVIRGI